MPLNPSRKKNKNSLIEKKKNAWLRDAKGLVLLPFRQKTEAKRSL